MGPSPAAVLKCLLGNHTLPLYTQCIDTHTHNLYTLLPYYLTTLLPYYYLTTTLLLPYYYLTTLLPYYLTTLLPYYLTTLILTT
jgi:hypothetical protein